MSMKNYARFIPGEEIDAVQQWQFRAMDTAAQLLEARTKEREEQDAAAQIDSQLQQAYQEGYAAGVEQGKLQAQAELQQQMQAFLSNQAQEAADKLTALFETAQQEQLAAEQAMAQGVLALSCELARQVLRHELVVNSAVVMPVLTEAIGLLGTEFKTAVVKLHPQDLAALGPQIQTDFAGVGLSLRADPDLLPGGCLVESAGTVIDGTLQKRWQRAVATLGIDSNWEVSGEPA
jgi:flagellar assembly protein FliH